MMVGPWGDDILGECWRLVEDDLVVGWVGEVRSMLGLRSALNFMNRWVTNDGV